MRPDTVDPADMTSLYTQPRLKYPNDYALFFAGVALKLEPAVQEYLLSRGVTVDVQERWSMGFWHQAVTDKLSEIYPPDVLMEHQLSGQFFSRIVIPLCDPINEVRGFVGRKLPESRHPVRYLYSKTKYFDQSAHVMGLEKVLGWGLDYGVLVEGPFDVILGQKFGEPTVSCHGTSFTLEQALLMRSVFKRLIVMPDGDKESGVLLKYVDRYRRDLPDQLYLAQLPDGSDPASVAQSDPDLFHSIVNSARLF